MATTVLSSATSVTEWMNTLVGLNGKQGLKEIIGSLQDTGRNLHDIDVTLTVDAKTNKIIDITKLTQDIPETSSDGSEISDNLFGVDSVMTDVFTVLHSPWPAFLRFARNMSVFVTIPTEENITKVIDKVITIDKLFNKAKMISAVLLMFVKKYSPRNDLYLLRKSNFFGILKEFTNELELIYPQIIGKIEPTTDQKETIRNSITTAKPELKFTNEELAEIRKYAIEEHNNGTVAAFICEMNAIINTLNHLIIKLNANEYTENADVEGKLNQFVQEIVNAETFNRELDEIITEEVEKVELQIIKNNLNHIIDTEFKQIELLLLQASEIDTNLNSCSTRSSESTSAYTGKSQSSTKTNRNSRVSRFSEINPNGPVSSIDPFSSKHKGGRRNKKTQRRLRKNPRVKSMKPKKRQNRRKTKSTHKKHGTKKH
jgi:hypothetical protein